MISVRNRWSLALTVLSFFLLVPGLMYPMLSLKMDGRLETSVGQMGMSILEKNASILATVQELYQNNLFLVAFLIFFFSVCVPVMKGVLLILALSPGSRVPQARTLGFIRAISKWSMADVFVVAIFLTYLSSRGKPAHSSHSLKMFGYSLDLDVILVTQSQLGSGFYFFLSYCMISLLALQLVKEPGGEASL